MNIEYRPWGLMTRFLPRLGIQRWSLLGAISTEERCLATWRHLIAAGALSSCQMLNIDDDLSTHRVEAKQQANAIKAHFLAEGGGAESLIDISLFAKLGDILQVAYDFGANGGDNIILDISSLPKRFFFSFIRAFRDRCQAPNIVVCCTMPHRYANDGNPLAEDPEPWRHLPGFIPADPEPENPLIVVGIGYESLGLTTIFESGGFRDSEVKMLFPFPSQPAGVARNWEFVRELSTFVENVESSVARVDARDVAETFRYIRRLTNEGARYAVLAPFGPKSLSLAMCLYATAPTCRNNATVFYTQPRTYHPQYSTGIAHINGVPEIYAYCIRLEGKDLYE